MGWGGGAGRPRPYGEAAGDGAEDGGAGGFVGDGSHVGGFLGGICGRREATGKGVVFSILTAC